MPPGSSRRDQPPAGRSNSRLQRSPDRQHPQQHHVDPRQLDAKISRQVISPRGQPQAPSSAEPRLSRQMTRQTEPRQSLRQSRETSSSPVSRSGRSSSRRSQSPGLLAKLFGGRNRGESPPPSHMLPPRAPSASYADDRHVRDQHFQQQQQLSQPLPSTSEGDSTPKRGMMSKLKSVMSFAPQRPADRSQSPHGGIAPPSPPHNPPPQVRPDDPQRVLYGTPGGVAANANGSLGATILPRTSGSTPWVHQQPPSQQAAAYVDSVLLKDLQHKVKLQSAELLSLDDCKRRLADQSTALRDAKDMNYYLDFKVNLLVDMLVMRVLELDKAGGAPKESQGQMQGQHYAPTGSAATIYPPLQQQQQQQRELHESHTNQRYGSNSTGAQYQKQSQGNDAMMRQQLSECNSEPSSKNGESMVQRVVGARIISSRRDAEPELIESFDDHY